MCRKENSKLGEKNKKNPQKYQSFLSFHFEHAAVLKKEKERRKQQRQEGEMRRGEQEDEKNKLPSSILMLYLIYIFFLLPIKADRKHRDSDTGRAPGSEVNS